MAEAGNWRESDTYENTKCEYLESGQASIVHFGNTEY